MNIPFHWCRYQITKEEAEQLSEADLFGYRKESFDKESIRLQPILQDSKSWIAFSEWWSDFELWFFSSPMYNAPIKGIAAVNETEVLDVFHLTDSRLYDGRPSDV